MFRSHKCQHPHQARDVIWNGQAWVTLCGLCEHVFQYQTEIEEKRNTMSDNLDAVNPSQILTEVEAALASVQSLVSFAEKFEFLLPPAAKAGITEVESVLNLLNSLLSKI